MRIQPTLLLDGYKADHRRQYPPETTLVYSNFTARASRTPEKAVVAFGFQYFVLEYLMTQFYQEFFQMPKGRLMTQYKRRMDHYLGENMIPTKHLEDLHDLGYLPLHVKALPEGTLVPLRVPMLTIYNTRPEFFWLTNMIETLLSNILWCPITSATTAWRYRKTFEDFAQQTGADREFIAYQAHDFSFRGLTGIENAAMSGAAHLLSFKGTDTIPAIDFLEQYYGANVETEIVGQSIPATEHSVMCMGRDTQELATFERLLMQVYPTGPVSIVSDTWNLWDVLTEILPLLKDKIMKRKGKLVIRPDSGDPELIICGDPESPHGMAARKGVMRLLWELFGGNTNDAGFKVLDEHVGIIYGEAISPERQVSILQNMMDQGFASSNVVFGIGSYTYQYVTRDVYGMAMKSTYGELGKGHGVSIFKDPITDDGLKKSATGLLRVSLNLHGQMICEEDVGWAQESGGLLQTIFLDGKPGRQQTLTEIRTRLEAQL